MSLASYIQSQLAYWRYRDVDDTKAVINYLFCQITHGPDIIKENSIKDWKNEHDCQIYLGEKNVTHLTGIFVPLFFMDE